MSVLAWRGLGHGPKRTQEHHIDLTGERENTRPGATSETRHGSDRERTESNARTPDKLPQKEGEKKSKKNKSSARYSGGARQKAPDRQDQGRLGSSHLREGKKKRPAGEHRETLGQDPEHSKPPAPPPHRVTGDNSHGEGRKTPDTQKKNHGARLSQAAQHGRKQVREKRKAMLGLKLQVPRGTPRARKTRSDKPTALDGDLSLTSFSLSSQRTACQHISPDAIWTDSRDQNHKRYREEIHRPQGTPGSHAW